MKKLSLLLLFVCSSIAAFCQDFDAQKFLKSPPPQRLVNDYTNTLTGGQAAALEQKLVAFNDSSSTQIAVVIIPNLGGDDVADYAVKLGRAWGVGGKQFNNGVVLLIAKDDHRLNIATGYGTEGALPDVTAKHIIDEQITPNFKGNDYYRGIDLGTDAIMQALKGEYTANASPQTKFRRNNFLFYIIIFIIIISIAGRKGGGGKGNYMSRRGSGLANALFWSSFLGGSGRGGWSGGGGGWSGGGGSSGGGGFGGFGGGSFGGGGASGSW